MESADEKENCGSAEENQEVEVKTSEKPKSGVLENRSLEVGKTEVWKSEKPKSGSRKN